MNPDTVFEISVSYRFNGKLRHDIRLIVAENIDEARKSNQRKIDSLRRIIGLCGSVEIVDFDQREI